MGIDPYGVVIGAVLRDVEGACPFAVPCVRLGANACVAHRPRHTLMLCCIRHRRRRATRPYDIAVL